MHGIISTHVKLCKQVKQRDDSWGLVMSRLFGVFVRMAIDEAKSVLLLGGHLRPKSRLFDKILP